MANNSVLAKMAVQISANTAEFNSSLKGASASLSKFQSSLKAAGGFLAGAFATSQLISVGKEIFSLTAQFQKMSAVLTNTLGSSSKAKKALNDIQKFAASTPFQITELTASFVKLANQGFVPTTTELRKLGDLAASTGKGFDQLTEAIIDAQTGEFERLKEFGIRAKKEGDNVTFTFKGVETQTKFTADSIRDYVLSLGDAVGVSGSMAAISNTIGGKFSNLVDNLEQLGTILGTKSSGIIGGFLDLANNALGSLNAALNDQVGALQEEQAELNVLVGAITDVNVSEEVRKQLITELNQKYPDFLKNLDVEKVTNEQLSARLKDVNDQFLRKIALQASEERFKEVQQDILDLIDDEVQVRKKLEEQQIKQNKLQNDSRKGVGVEQGLIRIAAQISLTEKQIESIQKERAKVQKELTDRLIEYDKALGIFNTTNNDYFEGTVKSAAATAKLAAELDKIVKFKAGTDGGGSNIPGEFFDEAQAVQDTSDKQLNSIVAQAEALLGLGDAYNTVSLNLAQYAIDQANATAAAEKAANTFLSLTSIGENFASSIASGQVDAVRALGNATLDIIDLYLKQAMAAAIAKGIQTGGPLPIGLAAAAVGVAAIRGLFSRNVGKASGGGGSSSVSNSTRGSVSGRSTQDVNVYGVIKGKDLFLISEKYANENKSTRT